MDESAREVCLPSIDYSQLTLLIPNGYYSRNLTSMAKVAMRFQAMKVRQGTASSLIIAGDNDSPEWREVAQWVLSNMLPH